MSIFNRAGKKVGTALLASTVFFGYSGVAAANDTVKKIEVPMCVSEKEKKEHPFCIQREKDKKKKEQEKKKYHNHPRSSLVLDTVLIGAPTLAAAATLNKIRDPSWNLNDYGKNVKWGFTHAPVFDNNPWYINYVGHPVFGAEAYLVARNRNYSRFESFLYSTGHSVAWEYLWEPAIGAKPSIQDLLITSTTGSLLGELRYWGKKELLKQKRTGWNKFLIFMIDPIDGMYRALK